MIFMTSVMVSLLSIITSVFTSLLHVLSETRWCDPTLVIPQNCFNRIQLFCTSKGSEFYIHEDSFCNLWPMPTPRKSDFHDN